ncbi:asparaginase domain-containing protein [Actinokineospora bangkokensis]|uniref:L-asparaginase n=1 Tax=Actinokineospora bangkokensis TaxID=1193682 RepID=A0A1Q9LSJ3_9PSEU|nr:asparaginase domain-containing protein [Actinokineospora bangkokensis]OLR94971.1 hypothetical protein BJP25_08345 [Actinokineospora bangkokensis]
MSRLLLLATGDTLAHVRHGSPPRVATGAELLARTGHRGVVRVEDLAAEPAWDTSPGTQLAIARRVRSALLDDGFDGVVVTHGLDTVEETAFLTDAVLGQAADFGSVVFTGALRCLDDPASDGLLNLAAALTAAADPVAPGLGALVCADGELHAARWVALLDTVRGPALTSYPFRRVGHLERGRVVLTDKVPPRPPAVAELPETDVALVKTYPGMPTSLLNAVVDAGARGVVLEGTGAANVPVELLVPIRELTSWDIPVVLASRAFAPGPVGVAAEAAEDAEDAEDIENAERGLFGDRVDPGSMAVDVSGLAARVGAIGARGLRAGQARVALMAALGGGGGVAAARRYFAAL